AQDMQRGIIDRFRSLPMSSSAVLTGRTIADLARNLFTVIIMLTVGFLVGFRPGGTLFEFLLGILLLLGVSFAFSWISAFIGLLALLLAVGPRSATRSGRPPAGKPTPGAARAGPGVARGRLVLREWRAPDVEALIAMTADPLVMEFFPQTYSPERTRHFVAGI